MEDLIFLEEIQRRYSTDTEKNHARADYYVNCHPHAEWEDLSIKLYQMHQFPLAKECKSFMSNGKCVFRLISTIKFSMHSTIQHNNIILDNSDVIHHPQTPP